MDLNAWLESLGLGQYADAFIANDIEAQLLPSLTADDLRELGVASVGHRRRLLDAIARLGATSEPDAVRPTSPPTGDAVATPAIESAASDGRPVQRRQITVLFCDLVGSTALSVRVDPEELRDYLNDYRAAVAATVQEYGGWIAQHLGDGVLAYFGYPQAREHDAEHAVRAALGMIEAVARLPALAGQHAQVRIGIATGVTVVGKPLDGRESAEAGAIGEAPNLAARAQSVAGPNAIVVAPSTRNLVGDLFHCRDMGEFELKGFAQPVRLWHVLGESRADSRFAALHAGRPHEPLVGREAEVRRAASRLAMSRAGNGQLLFVTGEPGLGKSRLVEHLCELADEDVAAPQRRLVFQCSPYNVAAALQPVRDYIERAAGMMPADAPQVRLDKLAQLLEPAGEPARDHLPLVAELLRIPRAADSPLEGLGSHDLRERTMRALGALLEAAAVRSQIVVVEDAQWMDPSTNELLAAFAARLAELPVLLVVTARSGWSVPPWLGGSRVGVVALDRLDAGKTRRLVEALVGSHQVPANVMDTIVSRSDGVPLFVEELTRGYLEHEARGDAAHDRIPSTLAESLLARLDGVAHGRDLVPTAAVLGREFPVALLVAITPLPEAEVRRGVASLLEAGVFVAGRSQFFGEALAFRHMLLREAAYELLLRRDRVRLHALVAHTVETRYPAVAEAVPHIMAQHYADAGEASRAIEYWRRASEEADRRSAYSEALMYCGRALDLVRSLAAGRERDQLEFDLLLGMIAPMIAVQGINSVEVEQQIELAAALGRTLDTRSSLIPTLALKLVVLGAAGNLKASYALAQQIMALAASGSEFDRLIAHRYMATTMIFKGQFREAIEHTRHFFEIYQPERHTKELVKIGPANHGVMMMVGMAECYTLLDDPAHAQYWSEEGLAAARADGGLHTLAQATAFGGCFLAALVDDVDTLARHAADLDAVTSRTELPMWRGHADLFSGIALMKRGAVPDGLEQARRGVHVLVTTHAYSNIWYICFAAACEEVGALEDAAHGLDLAEPQIGMGLTWLEAEHLRLRGRLKLAAGDAAGARELFENALAVAQAQGATLLVRRATKDLDRQATELTSDGQPGGTSPGSSC